MVKKSIQLPRPASPSIDDVLAAFLGEQEKRLKPRTFSHYRDAVDLLRHFLDDYGHNGLSAAEARFLEQHSEAEGSARRTFCGLFGPERIADNIGEFMDYFLVRKVIASEDFLRQVGTVVRKLTKWLVANGHVPQESGEIAAERAADSARDLPKARRAADILARAVLTQDVDPEEVVDENYLEFDHFTIVRLERGKLWLEGFASLLASGSIGPVPVPVAATNLLEKGWAISCALGQDRGTWYLLEVANVYP